jgi:hypothetical protein
MFFDLILEYSALFNVFLVPASVWYGFNFNAFDNTAYLGYAAFMAIFWIVCFFVVKLVVKLVVSIYNEIRR